jgi:uncharacterized protein (TIGR02145 family)
MKKLVVLLTLVSLLLLSCEKLKIGVSETTLSAPKNLIDSDSNLYNAVQIGDQMWMTENLKTTKYNDSTIIPLSDAYRIWNTGIQGYCWYNNDTVNKRIYGGMYNTACVSSKKLCPSGWHMPSEKEWSILISFLGGDSIAVIKLKETGTIHWVNSNTGTNESGFAARPGGFRQGNAPFNLFLNVGTESYWWSSDGSIFFISHDHISSLDSGYWDGPGAYVRCIKN